MLLWCVCEGLRCPLASGSPRSAPRRFPPSQVRSLHPERPSAPLRRPAQPGSLPRWRRRSAAAGAGSGRQREGWRGTRWSHYCCGHHMTYCPETEREKHLLFNHLGSGANSVITLAICCWPSCVCWGFVLTWAAAGNDESVPPKWAPFTSETQINKSLALVSAPFS